MVLMAKCQGPAPLGVGTMTAKLATTNETKAQPMPKSAVKSKQKNVR